MNVVVSTVQIDLTTKNERENPDIWMFCRESGQSVRSSCLVVRSNALLGVVENKSTREWGVELRPSILPDRMPKLGNMPVSLVCMLCISTFMYLCFKHIHSQFHLYQSLCWC